MTSGDVAVLFSATKNLVAYSGVSLSNTFMQIFKEPLLHFVLIGAVLFGFYSFINRPDSSGRVILSSENIQSLETQFSNDWNREPSAEERLELINDYIREELAVREGLELALDENDPVIRQRIRQKLELLVEEDAVVREPTEEELAIYLKENSDLFRNRDGSIPPLSDIRNLVIFEWENTQRIKELDQFYQTLETKYGVQVEK